LNGDFSRLTSAANSTSLIAFAVVDIRLGKAGHFFDPVAAITVSTAGFLTEISFW
jgi:hypothetical protein